MIRLKVAPEVSTLDFANGVSARRLPVPALTTRRAQTDVELRDGQSFAIAGLLDNMSQDDAAAIPFLSKLPIIGYLFKSKAERSAQTELMVLITPRLVRPLNPGRGAAAADEVQGVRARGRCRGRACRDLDSWTRPSPSPAVVARSATGAKGKQ